jgi:diguanylate cyclase (GGDEF)-like protein
VAVKRYFGSGRLIGRGEAAAIAAAVLLLALLCARLDLFEAFARYSRRHEAWQLDEGFVLLLFGGFAALLLLIRRARDMGREIEQRQKAEQRARDLARHDALTGLANRRLFRDALAATLTDIGWGGGECALFLINLDHFRAVNESHGQAAGDALLIEIAERLRAICEPGTVMARLGGDEFVCLLSYPAGADAPARFAAKMIRALNTPFRGEGFNLDIEATIGIARCPVDATRGDDLLKAACRAMDEGKRGGRGIYHFFQAEMDSQLRERSALEAELRGAIERGEIQPYFQPVMSLPDGAISGFEALARWEHPERGLLGPDLFIPLAEDIGVIGELSYDILRQACLASRDWPDHTTLSINISPVQLKDPWLTARILAILTQTGFAASRLIVEVTETAIIEDMETAAAVFSSLHHAGVRIALDDFGRGYASLYHLRELRFDHLKIDSAFVTSMDSPDSLKIVRAIAALGKSLGMPVTAEGVETRLSATALSEMGCDQAQGYLFGRPTSAAEAAALFVGKTFSPEAGSAAKLPARRYPSTRRSRVMRALP